MTIVCGSYIVNMQASLFLKVNMYLCMQVVDVAGHLTGIGNWVLHTACIQLKQPSKGCQGSTSQMFVQMSPCLGKPSASTTALQLNLKAFPPI